MERADLVEDFETGLFTGKNGRRYLRCVFKPENPVWIDVSGEKWFVSYSGKSANINWDTIDLPHPLKASFKAILLKRMKKNAPSYLTRIDTTLKNFVVSARKASIHFNHEFHDISPTQWMLLWDQLSSDHRSILRSLYQHLASEKLAGANYEMSLAMDTWNCGRNTQTLRVVVDWDFNKGSLTSLELELFRNALQEIPENESDADHAVRIFARLMLEILKRPDQILSVQKDGLWALENGKEFFIRTPGAKGQAARPKKTWQITSELANDLRAYSKRPEINALQTIHNRLIVFPPTDARSSNGKKLTWMEHGQVDITLLKIRLQAWVNKMNLISPRTKVILKVPPYRIRHTGATAMALQGVPRDQIQEVLEHDSPESADAYIKAVGSDLIPALERSTNRGVGQIFSELNALYFFKGTVSESATKRQIIIPIVPEVTPSPSVIGTCGSESACSKHPLWACYTCVNFLAWREAPHQHALEYVEEELKRWSKAEGGKLRSKLGKDFDRVGAAIREVINLINALPEKADL
jgi:hypothetical protein